MLAATPVLLLLQLLLLPVYLGLMLGAQSGVVVQAGPFIEAFLLLIVLPMALAPGGGLVAVVSPRLSRAARRSASVSGVPVRLRVVPERVSCSDQSPSRSTDPAAGSVTAMGMDRSHSGADRVASKRNTS